MFALVAFAFHHRFDTVILPHAICFLGKIGHPSGCIFYRSVG